MKNIFSEHLHLFGNFSSDEIDELYDIGRHQTYNKGELISKPGDTIEFGLFISKGVAANYYIGSNDKKIVTGFSYAPELMTINQNRRTRAL